MILSNSKRSIQTTYFSAIIVVVIIPLIILPIIGYIYSSELLKSKLSQVTDQNLVNIETNMNHIIEDVISASNVVALDDRISDVLTQVHEDKISRIELSQTIESMLHYMEVSNLYAYQTSTALIDFNGNIYYTGEGRDYDYGVIVDSDWFQEARNNKGFFIWEAPGNTILDFQGGITLTRLIMDDFVNPLGVLVIHIFPEERLEDVIKPFEEFEGTSRYLLNEDNQVIISSKESNSDDWNKDQVILESLKDETSGFGTRVMGQGDLSAFVGMKIISKSGWRLVQITPYDSVMNEVIGYRNIMIWINLTFIIILLFAIYLVTNQLTGNIKKLQQAVNKVTDGDLNTISVASGSLEVSQLSDSFNYMVSRVHNLIEEVKIVTEKKNATKLEALQAQINPHFLLNTLNGIKMLCVIEDAPTAENMLLSLGHLLSNTLGKFNDFITLEDEIECIRSYVRLQKMRYGNTFEVEYAIDERAKSIKVPVLFLQPIVENAIIHAFDEMDDIGKIIIEAITREDYLEIWIKDNGKGMDEETIERILEEQPRKEGTPVWESKM